MSVSVTSEDNQSPAATSYAACVVASEGTSILQTVLTSKPSQLTDNGTIQNGADKTMSESQATEADTEDTEGLAADNALTSVESPVNADQHDAAREFKEKKKSKPKLDLPGPQPPKKPLTPYMGFSKAVWRQVRTCNPGLNVCQVGTTIGKLWRELSQEDRDKYNTYFQQDKSRYDDELKTYLESTGLQASDLAKPRPKKIKKAPKKQPVQEDETTNISITADACKSTLESNVGQLNPAEIPCDNSIAINNLANHLLFNPSNNLAAFRFPILSGLSGISALPHDLQGLLALQANLLAAPLTDFTPPKALGDQPEELISLADLRKDLATKCEEIKGLVEQITEAYNLITQLKQQNDFYHQHWPSLFTKV